MRDIFLTLAPWVTLNAVLAVTTPLDVLFCGTIMLVILQVHHIQMGTLLTDRHQMEMSAQFSVVITTKQERMLRRELSIAFWSAWVLLTAIYIFEIVGLGELLKHPDDYSRMDLLMVISQGPMMILFPWINTITNAVCRARHRDIEPSVLCKDLVVKLCTRSCIFLTASYICGIPAQKILGY